MAVTNPHSVFETRHFTHPAADVGRCGRTFSSEPRNGHHCRTVGLKLAKQAHFVLKTSKRLKNSQVLARLAESLVASLKFAKGRP
jgi:hypothetical protein